MQTTQRELPPTGYISKARHDKELSSCAFCCTTITSCIWLAILVFLFAK
jgi:hypothetical protein